MTMTPPENNPRVLVEVVDVENRNSQQIKLPKSVRAALRDREGDVKSAVSDIAGILSATQTQLQNRGLSVAQLEASFGLVFGTEASLLVATTSLEASLEVKVTLSFT